MVRLLLTVFIMLVLVSVTIAFRGGHGRPLYGVIGDSFSMNNGVPMRGFYNFGSRDARSNLYEVRRK